MTGRRYAAVRSVAFSGELGKLTTNEVRVLAYMWAACDNGSAIVKAGVKLIAGAVGIHPKRVRGALAGLVRKRIVARLHKGTSRADRSVWQLLDAGEQGAPAPPVEQANGERQRPPLATEQGAPAPPVGNGTGSASAPERGAPAPPRVRVRGTEQDKGDGFAEFWAAWPRHSRKAAKAQCAKAWKSQRCEPMRREILPQLERFKVSRDWRKNDGEFIPAPLVWLNQRRWEADLSPPAPNGVPEYTPTHDEALRILQEP